MVIESYPPLVRWFDTPGRCYAVDTPLSTLVRC